MEPWDLIYYTTARGQIPVREFIDSLPVQDAVKIDEDLNLLAEYGVQLGAPHVKKLADSELWELRSRSSGMQHRILYVAL